MTTEDQNGTNERAPSELDDWAKSIEPSVGCKTCTHEAAATTKALLQAMARNRAAHITLKQLFKKVQELHPDYRISYWGFRNHVREHEADLYARARGND